MNYRESYEFWKNDKFFDEETRAEIAALTDEKEIEDRFYRDLEFGTGGLRGVLGAGRNRLNRYNIRKATAGFATYLLGRYGEEAKKRGIAVAYDCRNFSPEFAKETALTMCSMGIPAYLYTIISATPLLSFTVRELNCVGGVVITASHNPKEYNGYKAYDETGCQLYPDDADKVIECVNATDIKAVELMSEEDAVKAGLLHYIGDDMENKFADAIELQAGKLDDSAKKAVKIVYTPLHGAGLSPVKKVLNRQGYTDYSVVEAQCVIDGNFSTVASPNPENKEALEMAIAQAKAVGADLVMATDPDSDRVGIAVKAGDEYVLMTGNQTGAMVTNYVLTRDKAKLRPKSTMIKTIVTSEFGADIGKSYGLQVMDVLTGFKFIGDYMNKFEKTGSNEFIIGYEESYGLLTGNHARDKDACLACMLVAEMAAFYKAQGKTLLDVLNELYAKFGYYMDKVDSYTLKGKDGAEKIKAITAELRKRGMSLMGGIKEIKDYAPGIDSLPPSDVLKYFFEDGSWIAVRPSGTEPKIKVYYGLKTATAEDAAKVYAERKAIIEEIINA